VVSNKHTFQFKSSVMGDGSQFEGTFTIRRAGLRDRTLIAQKKAQLSGGYYYNEDAPGVGISQEQDVFCGIMAHLAVCVEAAPPWWTDDFAYERVLYELYTEVMAVENTFHGIQRSGSGGTGQEGSSTNQTQANQSGSVSPMVAQKVSPSLEP